MRIIHKVQSRQERTVEKEGEAGFLLANRRGDYLIIPPDQNFSNYQGLFFFDPDRWTYFKTVDVFRLERDQTAVKNKFFEAFRKYDQVTEKFFLADQGLCYDLVNYNGVLHLDLDFRYLYDWDDKGRIYAVVKDGKYIVVEYKKYADDALTALQATHYLVILGADKFEFGNSWTKRDYWFDRRRATRPEFFVFNGLRLFIENDVRLCFGYSDSLDTAKARADELLKDAEFLRTEKAEIALWGVEKESVAEIAVLNQLKSLTLHQKAWNGIFAGLPWFHQFWARDELISSVYLLLTKRYGMMKDLLFKYFDKINDHGRIPNRLPESELESADGVGWLFKRVSDFLDAIIQEKRLELVLSKRDLVRIFERIEYSTGRVNRRYAKDYLVYSGPKETWIDTSWQEDTREGARIEIQALQLATYRLAVTVGKMIGDERWKAYAELEDKLRTQVRRIFFDGRILADGYWNNQVDQTIRPNIFIAYYVYPELFSSYEWKKVFDTTLEKCWLDWGGLASIDKSNPRFCWQCTGSNDHSYHRGDSWYFLNNMAALCMESLDANYFKKYVERIIEASTEEILYSGLAGQHAEISSADHLESQGCLSQAWSAAMFLELMDRVRKS